MLFLCFGFSSYCCAYRLSPVSADLLQFLWFPQFSNSFCSSEKFTHFLHWFLLAFQVRADFAQKWSNFLQFTFCCARMLHDCSVSQSCCFIHFLLHRFACKVPSLLFRSFEKLEWGFWWCSVCYESQSIVFCFSFVRLCKFPLDFAGLLVFVVCFGFLAFLLFLSVFCLSPKFLSIV